MPVKMNRLESQKEIEEYKKWLSCKPIHNLKGLLSIFKVHQSQGSTTYPNLSLRIELVINELEKKQQR